MVRRPIRLEMHFMVLGAVSSGHTPLSSMGALWTAMELEIDLVASRATVVVLFLFSH